MQHAESNDWLAPEQYGSRKQLSAIDHCLNKRLSFDIIRQLKHSAALCVNDMKGCYDRIVHAVASVCMQRLGMDLMRLRSMFYTLQQLEHFIRTAQGISHQSFNAADVHSVAIQGIGQGNGAGPQIWAAISTVVLNMLRTHQAGAEFESPISGKTLQLAGYAYVDDTDIIAHSKDGVDDAVDLMQRSLDLWAGGLAATGGQLEPEKTFWYNIRFHWTNGKWRYTSKQEVPTTLTMYNADGTRSTLEQVEVWEGRRTLGVRLAPDGNNKSEFRYLREQCDAWANKIRSGMLAKRFTWQAFTTTILAKVAYALPATTFSKKECESITKRLIFTTLSKAGVNAHLPRDLVYGSPLRQGLGYPDLYVWQGAQALARLISFSSSSKGITTELFNISYESLCLETGFLLPLENEYNLLGNLSTTCYLKSLWEFVNIFQIQIRGPRNTVSAQRGDDILIMEHMRLHLATSDLIQFNRCRIYLQVLCISDICTAEGKYIDWYAANGKQNPTKKSRWRWPNQGEPPQDAWNSWKKGLATLGDRNRNGRLQLTTPVGGWQSSTESDWSFDTSSERVRHNITGHIYLRKPGRPTRRATTQFQRWPGADPTFRADHAATVIYRNTLELESLGTWTLVPHVPLDNFRSFVNNNQAWAWWARDLTYHEQDVQQLMKEIEEGFGFAVSDGSFKEQHGTASMVLEGKTAGRRITTSVITPGDPDDQCAYRSEAAGILTVIQVVNALALYTGTRNGKCIMGCDGKSALTQCFWKSNRAPTEIPHFDIIAEVREEIRRSPINWIDLYIPGHQTEPTDRGAILNNEMDEACKDHWKHTSNGQQQWFTSQWSVWLKGKKVTSNLTKRIREHCSIQRAELYWKRKNNNHFHNMDWAGVKVLSKKAPRHRQQWFTKHVSGFCSVGKMAKRIGLRPSDRCPRCEEVETAEHVWTCKNSDVERLWTEKMEDLRVCLRGQQTSTQIIDAIVEGLQGWRKGQDHVFNTTTTAGMLGELQNQMGWKHFFEGRVHKAWREFHTRPQGSTSNSNAGKQWLGAIVCKLHDIAWDLWEHRNGILHDKETGFAAQEADTKVRQLLWKPEIYRIKSIRQIITHDADVICQWGLLQKQQWILRVEAALQHYLRRRESTQYQQE
jgi:hypothetical protein